MFTQRFIFLIFALGFGLASFPWGFSLAQTKSIAHAVNSAPESKQLLQRLAHAYAKKSGLRGRFEQVFQSQVRGDGKTEAGRLWASPDGKVRWTYTKPRRKDFIFDGEKAYFYEPAQAQVTVFEHFADSPLWSAVQFLWGRGNIETYFEPVACAGRCPVLDSKAENALTTIRLLPKNSSAAASEVFLVVNTQKMQVERSIVVDSLGNKTVYSFFDLEYDARPNPKLFDFVIPENVSVLRATQHDQKTGPKQKPRPAN